ncbi:uncharacterized protein LOC135686410 isoform X2 [Rhopilema esculentum]|uniref:uncharacterized protein LOC135686410 isoform X2 n=1 Tax=Rhopilema esculentum TaxID=499914 RepID=UPI0031DBAACA
MFHGLAQVMASFAKFAFRTRCLGKIRATAGLGKQVSSGSVLKSESELCRKSSIQSRSLSILPQNFTKSGVPSLYLCIVNTNTVCTGSLLTACLENSEELSDGTSGDEPYKRHKI